MQHLQTRLAQPEDKEAVLAFCAQTWEWGDYLPEVWDAWLTERNGSLLVATLDERPVAVLHVLMVAPGESWFEGMRVDPAMRRQGISGALSSFGRQEARRLGATVMRLATHSDNLPAQQLLKRGELERVGTFVVYEAVAEPLAGEMLPVPATPAELPALLAWLDRSAVFPAVGGLLYQNWSGRALTREVLQERLASGTVLALRPGDDFLAIAICTPHEEGSDTLQVEYLDGTSEGSSRLAYGLRAVAATRGVARVTVAIPDLLMLRDALEGVGYHTDDSGAFWVYQQQLDP